MNAFENLLKNDKVSDSLLKIKGLAEKEGLSVDEFIAIVLPLLNSESKITEQDVKDYIIVKSSEMSNDDLDKVAGGNCSRILPPQPCAHFVPMDTNEF